MFNERKEEMYANEPCPPWRIQDFPDTGANAKGGLQPITWPIFPKTAWKWRKLDRGGGRGASPTPPPRIR